MRIAFVAACAVVFTSTGGAAATAPEHLRGTIASVGTSSFTLTTAKGPVAIAFSSKSGFAGALPATVDAIKPGTFVGSANVPSGTASRALEVVVFPDSMRGLGEGDYAWDLPASGSAHAAMTNGEVTAPHSMMTNATVTHVVTGASRTISVKYKGGTKTIAIGPATPIVRLEPGTKMLLVPGARAFVIGVPDSAGANAVFVVVGEHGTIPPM